MEYFTYTNALVTATAFICIASALLQISTSRMIRKVRDH